MVIVCPALRDKTDAGWSSMVARRAHNPKVVGSNPAPATNVSSIYVLKDYGLARIDRALIWLIGLNLL
jgi:hypothetical protein